MHVENDGTAVVYRALLAKTCAGENSCCHETRGLVWTVLCELLCGTGACAHIRGQMGRTMGVAESLV